MRTQRPHIHVPAPAGFRTGISLHIKVAVLVAGVYALFIGLSLLGLERFVLPSFHRLEQEAARQDLGRVEQFLQREKAFLVTTASDWAVWTETWDYLGGNGPDYQQNNLTPGAMAALKVDILALYDTAGRRVWGGALQEDGATLVEPPDLGPDPLPAGHPLIPTGDLDQEVSGILITEQGPLMVGMHAVTTNEGTGPVRGCVVFGRHLDEEAVRRLAEQAAVALEIRPLQAGEAAETPEPTRLETTETATHIRHLLTDLHGTPVLSAHLTLPRTISDQGRRAIRLALAAQTVSGLLAALFLMLTLGRLVVKPLQDLATHAVRLGRTGRPGAEFTLDRRDELGVLSWELNQMMGALADTRRRLLDQSFDSGRAEMAAGILHNIGNSITPLGAHADQARRALAEAPLDDVDLALGELGRDDAPAGRRQDLLAFAHLAQAGVRGSLRQTEESIARMESQVAHIGRILAEQEASSHAGQVLEECRLDLLLQESLALLDQRSRDRLEVEVEGDLAAVAPSRQPRVILQQVVINLLLNAAEATARTPDGRGRLRVGVWQEGPALVMEFADEGCGFTGEVRERLFERGFTTKGNRRGTGLGLHWCGNTLHALGGGLEAESPGPGGGAVFRVRLPWPPLPADMARQEKAVA